MHSMVAVTIGDQRADLGSRLRLGPCVLDLEARELRTADGRPIELRRKALEVLLLLGQHAGRVVDKRTLMDQVWPGVVVGDDSLTQTIVEIRRALDDRGRQVLCTVARRGFRLQPSRSLPAATAPALSIAVLPIAHDDAEPNSARLAAALTTELTSRAGVGLPDSKVVARETAMAVGKSFTDPRDAARRLGVGLVVCGDLRAVPHGWSFSLAIVDGASGTQRWSHRFALPQLGLSERIETVAAQAARAFIVEMHMAAAEIAAAWPLSERSAADLALQGWASIYEGLSPPNLERAQQLFEEAVAKDALHCRSLCGLCISNHFRAQMGWAPNRQQAQQRVVDIAARLEKLYPNDKLTALASGSAADIERRWELRLSIGDRLCERDPTSPTSHFARAIGLIRLGRFDECLEEIDTALRLSIDDFRAGWWHSIASTAHLMSGRHKQAVLAARRAIAANACLPWPPLLLAAALAGDGASVEAREILRQHLAREPQCNRPYVMMLLGGGETDYERGCEKVVATLESLGLPVA